MTNGRPIKMAPARFLMPGGQRLVVAFFFVTVYSTAVVVIDNHFFPKRLFQEIAPALYGSVVMGVLLVFRTNSAYERWWEARKLWGQLVNDTRNLIIKMRELAQSAPAEQRQHFAQLMTDFPNSLKDHLRGGNPAPGPIEVARNVYRLLKDWLKTGVLTDITLGQLDMHARAMMDVCGACERIKKSPIAGSYKALLWMGMGMYFLFLPWVLVDVCEWWAIPIAVVSCYFLIGLELLAEEVEDPFGTNPNDLPLESICTTIRESIDKIMTVP
jgi:ion channel-forming bestrophin family protein